MLVCLFVVSCCCGRFSSSSLMCCLTLVFFFKQKTAYEMRISDWSSDVCSSDLLDLSLWDKRKAKIMTLSGGMKRRVMIAKALSHEPEKIGRASCRERVCQYV